MRTGCSPALCGVPLTVSPPWHSDDRLRVRCEATHGPRPTTSGTATTSTAAPNPAPAAVPRRWAACPCALWRARACPPRCNCPEWRRSATRSSPRVDSMLRTRRSRGSCASRRAGRRPWAHCPGRPTTRPPPPGGAAYVFGGGTASGPVDSIVRVDPSGRAATVGRLPAALSDAAATRIGGTRTWWAATRSRRCARFWRSGPVTGARRGHAAAPAALRRRRRGRVAHPVAGGTDGATARREVLSVDPATHRVRVIARLPHRWPTRRARR